MYAIRSYYVQMKFSKCAVEEVLNKTATKFSYSGEENLDKETSYLFISNHRDIVLDSAILQCVLSYNGHRTTQITFGSNLMSSQFIVDLGKVNKMFTFYRGGSRVDIYRNALIHSAYIKKVRITSYNVCYTKLLRMYGVLTDSRNPYDSQIMPKTRVKNLFLTGQNVNMHGVLGVSVAALLTCGEILGMNNIMRSLRTHVKN